MAVPVSSFTRTETNTQTALHIKLQQKAWLTSSRIHIGQQPCVQASGDTLGQLVFFKGLKVNIDRTLNIADAAYAVLQQDQTL